MNEKSKTPNRRRRRWLRRAAAPTLASLIVLGTAVALSEGRAPFQGNVEVKTISGKWVSDGMPPVVKVDGATTASPSSVHTSGRLDLPAMSVFAESVISVTGGKVTSHGSRGYVSGIAATGWPSGTKIEMTSGCGKVTDQYAMQAAGVDFKITLPATVTPAAAKQMSGAVLLMPTEAELGSVVSGVTCPVVTVP